MTSKEIANKWQMNRYRTPGQEGGMDNKEFYDQLDEDISEYAKQQCILYEQWILKRIFPLMANGETNQQASEELYQTFLTETSI